MKTCPICKTTLFEDMEVCFGCMYRFGSRPDLEAAEGTSGKGAEEHGEPSGGAVLSAVHETEAAGTTGTRRRALPVETTIASPQVLQGGDRWSLRLEMVDEAGARRSWAIELSPDRQAPSAGSAARSMLRFGDACFDEDELFEPA